MLENKRALVVETLIRVLIIVAVIFLVIRPAGQKIYAAVVDPDKKYDEAFVKIAEQINEMKSDQETFSVLLKDKSAIIGFSKDADRWECYNCYVGIANPRPTNIVSKPINTECNGQACICICSEFEILKYQDVEGLKTKTDIGQCKGELKCSSLSYDIAGKTIIKLYPATGGTEHWNNGFLFVNGISGVNGLKKYDEESVILTVQKKLISSNTPEGQPYSIVGFCNTDMLDFNKDKLNLPANTCLNNDWAPKK
jgi:hypothetical protein